MMVCLLVLGIMHPGRTLVGSDSNLPKKTRTEKKAEKAEKKAKKAGSMRSAFELESAGVNNDSSASSLVNELGPH